MLAGLGLTDVALRHLAREPRVYQTLVDAGMIREVATVAQPAIVNPKRGQLLAGRYSKPVASAPVEAICRVKAGTTRTIITNAVTAADRSACASSLGLR